jgi:hypothetical protein
MAIGLTRYHVDTEVPFKQGNRLPVLKVPDIITFIVCMYVGGSNENHKTEIKIQTIVPLSHKLADMLSVL